MQEKDWVYPVVAVGTRIPVDVLKVAPVVEKVVDKEKGQVEKAKNRSKILFNLFEREKMIKRLLITIALIALMAIQVQGAGFIITGLTEQAIPGGSDRNDSAVTLRLGYFLGVDDEGGGLEPFIGTCFYPSDDYPQVIALVLCVAAVPYGTDLANVYVRPLDTRDGIYKGIGVPRNDFTDKYGGLSERTLILGNLHIIPQLMNEVDLLKKRVKALEGSVAAMKKAAEPIEPVAVDPNEAKE